MDRRHTNKIYKRRRIGALIVIGLILIFLMMLIGRIFNHKSSRSVKAIEINEIENEDFRNLIKKDPVEDVFKTQTKVVEDKNIYKDELLPYRQKKIKAHSLGRGGTPQALLEKQVYLTFDDGPSSKSTVKILDILKNENVKATFFIIGNNAKEHPDIIKRIKDEGHQVAIHTNTHNYKQIYSSPDALQKDIEDCDRVLKDILGEDFSTNIYRFPGGSYRKNKEPFVNRVEEMGYIYYDWNVLNGDAEGANPDVSYLNNKFWSSANGWNVIISLMHDTNAKTNTVESLTGIIKELKNRGYEFKTLGEV